MKKKEKEKVKKTEKVEKEKSSKELLGKEQPETGKTVTEVTEKIVAAARMGDPHKNVKRKTVLQTAKE